MKFEWLSVGDQDECTRKICFLGPYKLEHIENYWVSGPSDKYGNTTSIMMMANNVYLWDPILEEYVEVETDLECNEYKYDKSFKILEDWYGCNITFEKLMTGDADEKLQNNTVSNRS